jgi:hypothetical protein
MLREIGLPFSSDDLQLVCGEVLLITLSDGSKQHISVFAAFTPSNFITSHKCTDAEVEASINIVAN